MADFDLRAGEVSAYPFGYMRNVAARARSLLAGRTAEEVRWIADVAGTMIEQHVDELREQAIAAVVATGDPEWCQVADGEVRLIPERIYDVEVADNPVAALKASTSEGSKLNVMPDVLQHELFAALGLDLIGQTLKLIGDEPSRYELAVSQFLDEYFDRLPEEIAAVGHLVPGSVASEMETTVAKFTRDRRSVPIYVDTAAERAMQAVEAVCVAEWVRTIQDRIAGLESRQKAKRRAQTLNAEAARHAENRRYKELVLTEWEKAPRKRSARAAGKYFSDWLKDRERVERSPDVVMRWILYRAKELGIKWS